jgi:hypothetical protein
VQQDHKEVVEALVPKDRKEKLVAVAAVAVTLGVTL